MSSWLTAALAAVVVSPAANALTHLHSQAATSPALPSLYCWTMIADEREMSLLRFQFEHTTGIYACEEHDVFSPASMELPDGHWSIANGENNATKAQMGHGHNNAGDFIRLWDKILEAGKFEKHDFVVKIDPDTVFLSDRLRKRLTPYTDTPRGFFFRNWVGAPVSEIFGLLGPVEVFSRNAVHSFKAGQAYICRNSEFSIVNGEDGYMKACLGQLGVEFKQEMGPTLLHSWFSEENTCSDETYVAYHPFKDVAAYTNCYTHATSEASKFQLLRKSETPSAADRDQVERDRHLKALDKQLNRPLSTQRNPLLNGGLL